MKTIKISFLLALVTMVATSVQAQVSFGIRGGVNFSNINGKDASDDKLENKLIPGFNAGVNVEIPVADEFFVQPGLLFSTKGTKWDGSGNVKTTLGYLELPVNFLYKPDLGAGKMLLGVGPYVAYGVSGDVSGKKIQKLPTYYTSTYTHDLEWGSEMNQLKALDYGAYVGFGYQLQMGLQIRTIYGLSFANFSNIPNTVASPGSVFNLSVGYVLGRKLPGRFY